jgi:putative ABC transport system permease protein
MGWLRGIFSRRHTFAELSEEMQSHLEERVEELVANGKERREAEFQARREFGNLALTEQDGRAVWRWALVEDLWNDVRFGARMLAKSPRFTVIAVAALALGIGGNAAIYTILRGALSWNMGLEDHERFVIVNETNAQGSENWGMSYSDFEDYRSHTKTMEGVAAYRFATANLSDNSGLPERYDCAEITANGLSLAGMRPLMGRDFVAADETPGATPVLIFGYHVWRDRYGSDAAIVGKTVRLDEISRVVIGVMPAGRRFPEESDVWVPLVRNGALEKRDNRDLMVFGKLARGASPESARAQAKTQAAGWAQQFPDTNKDVTADVRPILEVTGVHFLRPLFLALYGAVVFVLLIACADVANMLLARATERSREIAIRAAVGAGKARILRQLLFENLTLAAAGGFFGWLVALGGLRWFDAGMGTMTKPVWLHLSMDRRALFYLAAISLTTAILFGLAPALRLMKTDVNAALKEYGSYGVTTGKFGARLSNALAAFQVALCMTLLASAGLMIRSAVNLYNVPIGVKSDGLMTMRISLPAKKYAKPKSWMAFQEELTKKVDALPGVMGSSVTTNLPLSGWVPFALGFEGRKQNGERPEEAGGLIVGPDYFQTMGVRTTRGRAFATTDGIAGPAVVVVNESFAAKFWPGEEAVGKRLRLMDGGSAGPWLTVIGVVGDVLQNQRQKAQRDSLLYLPFAEQPASQFFLVARTSVPPESLGDPFRRSVQEIDGNLAVDGMRTLEDHIAEGRLTVSMFSGICTVFAAVATVLAAIGLYGVLAHGVSLRRREIGLRMAIGAARADVMRLVLRQAAGALLPGLIAGLLLALATTRALGAALVGVSPTDPVTFAGISVVLILVAVAACWVPMRRATRVDPMVALRYE